MLVCETQFYGQATTNLHHFANFFAAVPFKTMHPIAIPLLRPRVCHMDA